MGEARTGWDGVFWRAWSDRELIRGRLLAGADPNGSGASLPPPLHRAAQAGSPEVVADLAALVRDVDVEHEGRTALWSAVHAGRGDNARVLEDAGADSLRPGPDGWSPWRLSLASVTPGLLRGRPGLPLLSTEEEAAVTSARRLAAVFAGTYYDGLSLACVAGVSVAEAVQRLGGTAVGTGVAESRQEAFWSGDDSDDVMLTVGVTDVPGGCVLVQPWAYTASTPGVGELLSPDTVCYAMYANPKSGNQGNISRDGRLVASDMHPGGGSPHPEDGDLEMLRSYLYRGHALAYCCAYAGLKPTDPRPVVGPPDLWIRLPSRDY